VNTDYIAFNENDLEYEIRNTPVKFVKEYGEDGNRETLKEIHDIRAKREYRPYYSDIGNLKVKSRSKCNSTYYYEVKFIVDRTEITPYLDSTALKLNYKEYGKENVNFNLNSKMLETRRTVKKMLFFDKDKEWKVLKLLSLNDKIYDHIFGKGFQKCVENKSETTEYLPY